MIRRPSPSETIGGGAVADLARVRLRRRAETVAALERRTAPSAASRLLASLDVPRTPAEAGGRSGLVTGANAMPRSRELVERRPRRRPRRRAPVARRVRSARHARRCVSAQRRIGDAAARGRVARGGALGAGPAGEAVRRARRAARRGRAPRGAGERPRAAVASSRASRKIRSATGSSARAALAKDPLQPPSPAQLETEHGLDRELVAALAERGDVVRIGTEAVFLPEAVTRFARVVVDELADQRIDHGRSRARPLRLQPQARASAPTIPRRSRPDASPRRRSDPRAHPRHGSRTHRVIRAPREDAP